MQSLRSRLYKKHEILEPKNLLVIKQQQRNKSTDKQESGLSKARSNSSVRLPSLQRLQIPTPQNLQQQQQPSHHIHSTSNLQPTTLTTTTSPDRQRTRTLISDASILDSSHLDPPQTRPKRSLKHISTLPTPTKLPTNEAITYLLRTGMLTIPKLIALLNTSHNEEFVYLRPLGIYEYEACDFKNKGEEYLVVSRNGVLTGQELVTMEKWLRDQGNYNSLRKIELWRNYVIWKSFFHWKAATKKHITEIASGKLLKANPSTSLTARLESIKIREQCIKLMENYQIFQVRVPVVADFAAYKAAQQEWCGKLQQKIAKRQANIESSLLSICFEAVREFPLVFETKEELNKSIPFVDGMTQQRFDVKSALKNTLEKLYRVVRAVDLMFMESLGNLINNSLTSMSTMLRTKISSYELSTSQLSKLPTNLSKDQYTRTRDDLLKQHQYNNWISFDLCMNLQDTLKLSPSLLEVNNLLHRHVRKCIQAIAEFKKPMIMSPCFEFIRRNVKQLGSMQDRTEPPVFTFIDYLANCEGHSEAVAEFSNALLQFLESHRERLQTLQPFVEMYSKYSEQKSLPDFLYSNIDQTVDQLHIDQDFIQRLQDGQYILYGFVSHRQFKNDVLSRLAAYKTRLMQYIPSKFHQQVLKLKDVLLRHQDVLETLATDVRKFVIVMREVGTLEESIGRYQTTIDDFRNISAIFEQEQKHPLNGCNELASLLSGVKNKMSGFLSTKDSNLIRFRHEVSSMWKDLQTQVSKLQLQLSDSRFYTPPIQPISTIHRQLQLINTKMQRMLKKMQQLSDYMLALSVPTQRLQKLQFLWLEFTTVKNVWGVLMGWEDLQEEVSKRQLAEVELAGLKERYETWMGVVEAELRKNQKLEIAEYARKRLAELMNNIVLVEALQSKHLRPQDWHQITHLLNLNLGPLTLYTPSLTFSLLLTNTLTNFNPQLTQLVVKAKKQTQIQSLLSKFQHWWANMRLQTTVYDLEAGVNVFTDNEQLRREIDENMAVLLTVLNSKYGGFARQRCNMLLRNLTSLIELLRRVLEHQEAFLELYPVLSSAFCEKQLPMEYKKYQSIVTVTIRLTKTLLHPVKGLTEPTQASITNNLKQFESLRKTLSSFMQKKRVQFQRFYFLQDRQLMQLLAGLATDASLHRMFEGITGWYEQDGTIVGVRGSGGQQLRLMNWSWKNQELEVMFRQLEEAMRYTLKTLVRQTLFSYEIEMKNLRELECRIPWMCVYTVQWILYCKQMQLNYFNPTHPNDISLQLHLLSTNLHQLLQNPLSNSNLITLTLHMLHLTQQLQHNRVSHVLDFHWQEVLRFYYQQEVVVRSLGGVFEWGGEYQGRWEVMVNTKDIRRAYSSVLGGLNWGVGTVLQGPSGTGKTETLKELARSMAKFCLVFNCSTLISTQLLQRLLAGLCYTGSWLCLDELNRLDIQVMSVVATQISQIRSAILLQKDHFTFSNRQIELRPGIGIFATMNPNYRNRTDLTDNLKAYFRCVSVNLPDYQRILQTMLYSRGFREAAVLAGRICKVYQLLNVQFNQQRHYDFGLRSMKQLVGLVEKGNKPRQSEEVTVRIAIEENLKPRLTERDLVVFEKTLGDLFPRGKDEEGRKEVVVMTPFEEKLQALKQASQLGIIILGETSCKTTLIEQYLKSKSRTIRRFNPNSLPHSYLFGGKQSGGWQQGVIQQILKDSVNNPQLDYILYLDGQLQSQWVQNFNTLLDDSKVLILPSGTRLKLSTPNFHMLLQTPDLLRASPATITRCSILYLTSSLITLPQYIDRKLRTLKFPADLNKALAELFVRLTKEEIRSVMNMLPALMPEYLRVKQEGWMYSEILGTQKLAIYLIALIGAFEKVRKGLTKEQTPPKLPLSRYMISFERYPEGEYVAFQPAQQVLQMNHELFIPNITSQLCNYLLQKSIKSNIHILIKGPRGTSKSTCIRHSLSSLFLSQSRIHMTPNTTSLAINSAIKARLILDKKNEQEEVLLPIQGERLVVVVDDISLGSQQSSEYLRSFLERRVNMELRSLDVRQVRNCSVVAQGNVNNINRRLQQHLFAFQLPMTTQICHSIFLRLFTHIIDTRTTLSPPIKNQLFSLFLDKFTRVLVLFLQKSYNMRHLSQLSLCLPFLNNQNSKTSEQAVLLIFHEVVRVFFDGIRETAKLERLQTKLLTLFTDNFNRRFVTEFDSVLRRSSPVGFGRVAEEGYHQLSQDLAVEQGKFEEVLRKQELRYLLPRFITGHLCRVLRVYDLPYVNCLYIGSSGSGRRTIIQIASKIRSAPLLLPPRKGTEPQLSRHLFTCLRTCITTKSPLFLLIPIQTCSPVYLQLLESLLSGSTQKLQKQDSDYAYDHINEAYKNYESREKSVGEVVWDYVNCGLRLMKVIVGVGDVRKLEAYPALLNSCYWNQIGQWPESALEEFSTKIMDSSGEKGLEGVKEKMVRLSVEAFGRICQLNRQPMEVSPMSHIKFMRTFLKVLSSEQLQLKTKQQKLSRSILKMAQTTSLLTKMKQRILQMQPQLQTKKDSLLALLPGLQSRRKQATQARHIVQQDQLQVQQKKSQIQQLKRDAQRSLKQAQPLLTQAANSVSTIKRTQLSQIKTNTNPHRLILFTLQNLNLLLGSDSSWQSIKRTLSDTELLTRLKNCTPKYEDYQKVKKRMAEHPEWTLEAVEKVSVASRALMRWVLNAGKFSEVSYAVERQKQGLGELRKELINAEYVLKATQEKFQAVNQRLQQVQSEYTQTSQQITTLENQLTLNKLRLSRAGAIQNGLGSSVERWKATVSRLETVQLQNFTNCLFMAALLQLSSCYPSEIREEFLQYLKERAVGLQLPFGETFDVLDLFDPIERQEWQRNGLSPDHTSLENVAFLKYHMEKHPVIIDPDNQATQWLKKTYDPLYTQTKSTFSGALPLIQQSIKHGHKLILLFQNQLDEFTLNILQSRIQTKGPRRLIQLSNTTLQAPQTFHLLLCTKQRNPCLSPHLLAKHPVINFSVTRRAMQSQLIVQLLKQQNPELYDDKVQLELIGLENRLKLARIENQIIDTLAENKQGLLDDERMVELLERSTTTATDIALSELVLGTKIVSLEALLGSYERLCKQAAAVYIQLGALNRVNPMLNWGYASFTRTFLAACLQSVSTQQQLEQPPDQAEPNQLLYESFVFSRTDSVSSRPTSSLSRMSSRIEQPHSPKNYRTAQVAQPEENLVNNSFIYKKPERVVDKSRIGRVDDDRLTAIIDILLRKFKVAMDENDRRLLGLLLALDNIDKHSLKVLFQASTRRQNLRAYSNVNHITQQLRLFDDSINSNPQVYTSLLNSANPFTYHPRLSPFSVLLLTRMLAPQKFPQTLDRFITHCGFGELLRPLDFSVGEIFRSVENVTPGLFIMGDDPLQKLLEYLSRRRMMKHTLVVSMGEEDQAVQAGRALEREPHRETVLILHNLHITPSIFPQLSRMVEQMELRPPNPKFRLLILMKPVNNFPSSVSGRCTKVLLQTPTGVKNKMHQLIKNNYHILMNQDTATKAVGYSVTLLHSILSDRVKFGRVGWNVPYQFTQMQYQNALKIVKQVANRAANVNCLKCNLDEIEEIQELLDFTALRHLIGGINYEGRLTDQSDRAKLRVLTQQFLTSEIFKEGFRFMELKGWAMPKGYSQEELLEHVEGIREESAIFGLNPDQPASTDAHLTVLNQLQTLFSDQTSISTDQQQQIKHPQLQPTKHPLQLIDSQILTLNTTKSPNIISYSLLKSLTQKTKIFDLRAFTQPRKFLTAIKKQHALKNNIQFQLIHLHYTFTPKQQSYGICNLYVEAGRIANNFLEEGLSGPCPVLYLVPWFKKRDKHEKMDKNDPAREIQQNRVSVPLYRTRERQGEINSFGENMNLIAMVELPAKRRQEVWVLRGTALVLGVGEEE